MADQLIPYSDSAPAGERLPAAVKTELGISFAPLVPHIRPSGEEAAIRIAAAALHALGGGTVLLPPKTITLTSPLPVLKGVKYVGVEPVVIPINPSTPAYLGDMEWNYAGGTVLVGNGTFAAFEANGTALGAPADPIGNTQISNCGIMNVGIDNVTCGIKIGNENIMGAVWSEFKNIWVKNATQWGTWLVNFQHCKIDRIHTTMCQNGQYYGNLLPYSVLMCGNSVIGELFHMTPRDSRDRRLCRGIVFEAGGPNATFNQLLVERVQVNAMSRNKLSVTATFTSGSTSIAVPDGTKFLPGVVVVFTATGQGFTGNQAYVVSSVVGNTITLANDRISAAVSATGSGTLTLETWGFPNMEVARKNAGATVRNSRFLQIDVEGASSVGLYTEGSETNRFDIAEIPITGNLHFGVVGRSTRWCDFYSGVASPTDFDGNSTTSSWYGHRGPITGRVLAGHWIDNATSVRGINIGGGASGQTTHDLQYRASPGFLYPATGMGESVKTRDNTLNGVNGSWVGNIVFAGGTAQTHTLSTIIDANPNTSSVGQWFEFSNVGAAALTVATDGSQVFNKIAGKTSLTVAQGTALRVTAVKDNSGNLFWLAKAFTLAT